MPDGKNLESLAGLKIWMKSKIMLINKQHQNPSLWTLSYNAGHLTITCNRTKG